MAQTCTPVHFMPALCPMLGTALGLPPNTVFHLHFAKEEIEAQRGEVACPASYKGAQPSWHLGLGTRERLPFKHLTMSWSHLEAS